MAMTNEEALALLDEIDQPDFVWLTDWEADFVDSLLKRCEEGRNPTDKQESILRRIYTEKVGR